MTIIVCPMHLHHLNCKLFFFNHCSLLVLFRTEFDKSYAEKLAIPTRFSAETTACIKSGVLTKRSRDEIVNSLATLMLVHTSRPTPEDG